LYISLNPEWPNPIIEVNQNARICGVVVFKGEMLWGIRRITATPLYTKAENWRLGMPEISVYPASIFNPWIPGWICPLPLPYWPSNLVQAIPH
jgi:hypothetical protein